MALRKSELYTSLWESCDELRGGMDASQYKDYVLTLLFMKYVSDKYAGDPNAVIVVPEGGSFVDMVALKGQKEIGDRINKIIGALAEANNLKGVIDVADFNDEDKLGRGKDMVDRLSNLVGIFEKLDLSANRAEGDDLLGDAYEYLMRNFATESGKSKGQFYTPAEVSRIMARVIGIEPDTPQDRTVYDPTCGSGSLLLKASDEARRGLSIYGQERDNATAALARMNMILHDCAGAEIWRDNTLTRPHWTEPDGSLKKFDFAVANPPFSFKSWSNGLDPVNDEFGRFEYGVPPAKNGDYAFLLHVIASLKSTGTGAVILPHGVLFRGGSEAAIRANLIRRGLIQGVIGLPPNLFYGTGIPACIVVIDKSRAATRDSLFLIDASRGFRKDGNKNRLRAQDIHRIVDVFTSRREAPRYSRRVPVDEIAAKDYNLNLPRYIDATEPEDLHDLDGHLNGGIPDRDLDDLDGYWSVFPDLRGALFESERDGYSRARVPADEVKAVILVHPDFAAFRESVRVRSEGWWEAHEPSLRSIAVGDSPKALARALSEDLLRRFEDAPLIDAYDVYQSLMDYWAETMQDDVYVLALEGWAAGRTVRPVEGSEDADFSLKKGRKTVKYVGELLPASLVIERYFADEKAALEDREARLEGTVQQLTELEEEHGGDEGVFNGLEGARGGVAKGNVQERVMELKVSLLKAFPDGSPEHEQAKSIRKTKFGSESWQAGVEDDEELFAELDVLHEWLRLSAEETGLKREIKDVTKRLYEAVLGKYAKLGEEEIRELLVERKWKAAAEGAVEGQIERVTARLVGRVQKLEDRYALPLPSLSAEVARLSIRVEQHLETMGFAWA